MALSPLQTVTAIYDAFGRRDAAKAFSLFSPDIEIVQSTELPWGGVYHGHAGAQQFFGKLTALINSTLEIDRMIDATDHVVVIGWTTGTVNATGARYRVPIAHVWKIVTGAAVRVQFFIDHPTMAAALAVNTPAERVPA